MLLGALSSFSQNKKKPYHLKVLDAQGTNWLDSATYKISLSEIKSRPLKLYIYKIDSNSQSLLTIRTFTMVGTNPKTKGDVFLYESKAGNYFNPKNAYFFHSCKVGEQIIISSIVYTDKKNNFLTIKETFTLKLIE